MGNGVRAVARKLTCCTGILLLASAAAWAQDNAPADCSACHDTAKKLAASQHSALGCNDCHSEHKEFPHPEKAPKPQCATCHPQQSGDFAQSAHSKALQSGNAAAPDCATCHNGAHEVAKASTDDYRKKVPETCGMCHGEVSQQFQESVHGKAVANGVQGAPVCTDCHGEHSISETKSIASPVHPLHVRDTCARCHADVRLASRFGLSADKIASFDTSFHGLASKSGRQTVANCASCHGFHNILPSRDPKSTVHVKNLSATCGQCHPGAGSRFAIGAMHVLEGKNEPAPVRFARLAYLWIIPFTIGLMFLHHFGDYLKKLINWRFRGLGPRLPAAPGGEVRMHRSERIQHALLAVSFIVLAWTGFALRYPDQWWAAPLVAWESSWPVRGTVHRVAAVIFSITGVLHLIALIVNRQLRRHWLELMPRRADVWEGIHQLSFNLGLRAKKPRVSPHSYVEKAEYWAVVWGGVVMGLTGLLLWANNWTLRVLPKVWLDVAASVHFYEAVLATLAIVVWHFYTVIFDPEVYPMDPAWLTGKSVRQRESHHTESHHAPEGSGAHGQSRTETD